MKFKILHDIVGPFTKGQVIHKDQFGTHDIARLINLGAIESAPEDMSTDEVQPGPLFGPNAPKTPSNPGGYTSKLQEVVTEFAPTKEAPLLHEDARAEIANEGGLAPASSKPAKK